MCTKCAVKMTVDECSVKKEVLGLEHEWRRGPLLQLWFVKQKNINSRITGNCTSVYNKSSFNRTHYNIVKFTKWTFSTKNVQNLKNYTNILVLKIQTYST
jgi:hypothetical protein